MRMHHLSGTDEKGRTYAMTYEEARSYIEYTDTMGSVLGLDSIKELLRRLGDPQDAVPVIHIAGTNGKGSICAFLDEILESAGYSVGRYISPTIFTYLERFQIDKEYMSEEDFAVYLETVKDAADDMVSGGWGRPTSFETETAVAFCYFCDKKVDFLLLETGMGGLEDATNVCSHPVCTIIASISMDHMHFLGNTLRDIYRQKLGILKKNCPCVAYPLASELEDMWDMACEQNNISDLAVLIREKDIEICGESVGGSEYIYDGQRYELQVPGIYQIYNSATAAATAHVLMRLGYELTEDDIRRGLKATFWKGRFQKLMDKPLMYVDGAHNPGGWRALRQNIDEYFAGRDLIYICGVFKDKDYEQMLRIMMPGASAFIAVEPDNPRALSRHELKKLAGTYIDEVYEQEDVDDAVRQAMTLADGRRDSVVMVFGSLSFIGPIIDRAEHGGYIES